MNCLHSLLGSVQGYINRSEISKSELCFRITVVTIALLFVLGVLFLGLAFKEKVSPALGVSLISTSVGIFFCLSSYLPKTPVAESA